MRCLNYKITYLKEIGQRLFISVISCLLFVISGVANAEPISERSPEQWLEKMQSATVNENYRGTFMFSRGKMSSSMSIVHRLQNNEEQELLKQLDGEMGEIVRNGTQVMCVFPDNRVVQLEQSKYSNKVVQLFSNFMPDQKNYRLKNLGACRQVERPCVKLAIEAEDQHRYSYFLWLDKQTGLLLKSVLKNHEGIDLERFQYTHIEFPDVIDDQDLEPMNAGSLIEHVMIPTVKKDIRWPNKMMWKSMWIPSGFMRVNGENKPGSNVMVYSDGLANYSIFVEKIKEGMMPEGASQVGATVAYTQVLQYNSHEYGVTVIGEIPAMTAMLVAESVKPEMQK